jgi:proteasome lid subunit RPN8/RPN11
MIDRSTAFGERQFALSQDEIVFDEVCYREPERMCRPDRDRRYACLAYEVPAPSDLPIFLDRRPADAIERHALRDTSVELGGILLGKECVDDQTGLPFGWVTESLAGKHYEYTQARCTYTHDSWEEITRERDRLHPGLDIVGWYHTHPDFGIFLSGHDLFIHRHFFAQPLQVAYVVDPLRQTRGFFQWREGTLAQVGGYYVTSDRGDRVLLARQVNDLENIPNTSQDGGGGALSPRLEAELLAMLTRPAATQSTATERTLLATMFGMLGVVAGVVAVLASLWLYQFHRSVEDQQARLVRIGENLDRASAGQRLALEALLAASQTPQRGPDALVSQFGRTVRDLDDARTRLDGQKAINDTLAGRLLAIDDENKRLKADLSHAKTFEKDAKEVVALRERIDELEGKNDLQSRKLTEQEEILETAEGKKAARLVRLYDRAWYTAVAGWGVALLLTLGLLAAFGLKAPAEATAEPEFGTVKLPPASRPAHLGGEEDAPPHHIS